MKNTNRGQQGEAGADTQSHSEQDVEIAIKGLEGEDKVGRTGKVLGTAGGVAAGAAAAGAVAAAAGATTILGSTTLGSLLGGFLVASTPVGWVIGCAVAGGAAAYGVSRMIHSGGRQDEVRRDLKQRLRRRLDVLRRKGREESELRQLRTVMSIAIDNGILDDSTASRILEPVEEGSLPAKIAIERVRGLLAGTGLTG